MAYRRRGAVVRQHALLVPVHAADAAQLRAALAAAVRHGPLRRRPLPPERPRDRRRPPGLRVGVRRHRRAGGMAADQGDERHRDGSAVGTHRRRGAVDAALAALAREHPVGARFRPRHDRPRRPEHETGGAVRRSLGLHARARFLPEHGVHRTVARPREQRVRRASADGPARRKRALLRRAGAQPVDRQGRGRAQVRHRRQRDLRRAGAAGHRPSRRSSTRDDELVQTAYALSPQALAQVRQ